MIFRDRSLFLKDAGIDFEYVRYPYDTTWPQTSEKLQQQKITRSGKLPALEYGNQVLTQVSCLDEIDPIARTSVWSIEMQVSTSTAEQL